MNINQIEQSLQEYYQALEAGQITKEEYVVLLQGLEVEKVATLNAEELQKKEQLNTYINAAITAASLTV